MSSLRSKVRNDNGVILYRGPSLLTGQPIVCIAVGLTRNSANSKTGGIVQTFILADGESPIDALRSGGDSAVCGDCPHRPQQGKAGSCYVNVGQAPLAVWRAYRGGRYATFNGRRHLPLFRGRMLRLGSYGDPAAVPLAVWRKVCRAARSWAGYTHQWRTCARGFARFVMASCETVEDRVEATARGYRTFRVRLPEEPLVAGEFACPASDEGGKRLTCENCRACSGAKAGGRNASPSIVVHGLAWKTAKYRQVRNDLRDGGRLSLTVVR